MFAMVKKYGWYIKARSDFNFQSSLYNCTSSGEIEGGGYIWTDGEIKKSRLVLTAGGMSGCEIARILREEFKIEVEMISESYVILMTGAGDTDEMTDALIHAIENFPIQHSVEKCEFSKMPIPTAVMTMANATSCEAELIDLTDADGRISAESVMAYPPGIPIIAPGERIDSAVIDFITKNADSGVRILTSRGEFTGEIKVTSK